ncbi:MAG: hypothetical protein ABSE69_19560 [Roseiarcus sp.]
MDTPPPPAPRPRLTVRERAIRRDRIFARMLEGQSYAAIAAAEAITPRRVRKIVQEALAHENVDPRSDFVLVQIARLEEALRLVEQKMAEGKLNAVDRLIKVLEQLDRYHAQPLRPSSIAYRGPGLSEAMLVRLERAAASRDAVASRAAAPALGQEISVGKPEEGQVLDIARFAEASDGPRDQESTT